MAKPKEDREQQAADSRMEDKFNTGGTVLAIKVEETEGSAETLAGADAVLVANAKFTPSIAMGERNNMSSSLSGWASIPGARSAKMEFDVELKGSGTAATAPALGKLLQGCGFGETVSAGVSVTYKPASASIGSYTLAMSGRRD